MSSLPTLDDSIDHVEEVISEVCSLFTHQSSTGAVQIIAIKASDGMGKSTILKSMRDKFNLGSSCEGRLFDVVLLANLSREANAILRLQEDLIGLLGLSPPLVTQQEGEASDMCRVYADKLSSALSNKRFLLLLDDVEERLDLASLGIPTTANQNMSSAVVITASASYEESLVPLSAGHVVEVRSLNERQSWELFWRNAGRRDDPRIRDLGGQLVRLCRGLPLALVTVGWSMSTKRRHRDAWERAVQELSQMLEGKARRPLHLSILI